MDRPKALYVLSEHAFRVIYGEREQHEIGLYLDVYAPPQTPTGLASTPGLTGDMEAMVSGWGAPRLDAEFLKTAPNLKVVFYGAGSIKGMMTEAAWDRGIRVTSAYAANAVPVAEYTLSQILFGLKNGWRWAREAQRLAKPVRADQMHGAYETTVGLVSLGMVGKAVCRLLKHFDVNVIAFDPFVPADTARELGVELVRSLDDVFRRAHVVSLHTPWLKETENLIRGRHFDLMQPYTTFINTARGAVVFEAEMIEALERRPDITAVLDVTHPEPPAEGSPLLTLPNVVWTPHIAGSVAGECRRMGQYMIQEIRRYLEGLPMTWEISREKAALLA